MIFYDLSKQTAPRNTEKMEENSDNLLYSAKNSRISEAQIDNNADPVRKVVKLHLFHPKFEEEKFNVNKTKWITNANPKNPKHQIKETTKKNMKPFICDNCGKYLSTKQALSSHKRMHLNNLERNICGKIFATKVTLKNHQTQ